MVPQRSEAAGLPKGALFFNTFAFAIAFAMWVMFGPSVRLIAEELSLSTSQAAFVKAVPILTGSVLRIPIGMLTDRVGARRMFPVLMVLGAVATVAMTTMSSMSALIGGGLVMGMVGTTFVVGVQSVSSWTPPKRQGFALGIFGAGNLGTAITTLGLPILLVAVGWRTSFQVYAVAVALTGVGYFFFVKDRARTKPKPTLSQLLAPAKTGRAWLFGLYYTATFGVFVATTLILTDVYMDGYGMSLTAAGALATIFTFTASVARVPGGALADRFGANRVLLLSLPTIALCLTPIAFGPPLVLAVGLVFIAGVAMGFGMAGTFKAIPQHFPERVGAVGGLVGAVGGVGGFYLPLLGAWIGEAVGTEYAQITPLAATAGVAFFAAVLATRSRPVPNAPPSLRPPPFVPNQA